MNFSQKKPFVKEIFAQKKMKQEKNETEFNDPFPPAFFVFYLCLGPSREGVSETSIG